MDNEETDSENYQLRECKKLTKRPFNDQDLDIRLHGDSKRSTHIDLYLDAQGWMMAPYLHGEGDVLYPGS